MKRKLALIIAMMTLAASLTACGGAKDTDAKSEKEPVVEQTVTNDEKESVVDSEKQVTDKKDVEEKFTEEASSEEVVAEMTYEVSAVMMPDGSTWDSEKLPCLEYYETPDYEKPYYTVTNTSNSAYRLHITAADFEYFDNNFEVGESITLPAFNCQNEDGTYFWANIKEACESYYSSDYDIDISEAPADDTRNRVQAKTTVTYDATLASDSSCPVPSLTVESAKDFKVDYIILYDEAGNAFNSNCVVINYNNDNFIIKDCILMYNSTNSSGEPFTWASADIYYSYEVAAE